jgi:glycosyltransferase involved in cell wall biosynthesis
MRIKDVLVDRVAPLFRYTGAYRDWKAIGTQVPAFEVWQMFNGPNKLKRRMLTETLSSIQNGPKFSVIMPVFDPPVDVLNKAVESVLAQSYKKFTLVLVDDCSTDPKVRLALERWALSDERIKTVFRKENGHISAATNSGAQVADGDFLAFIDNDDELAQDALAHFAMYINLNPATDIVYSDDAKFDTTGSKLVSPKFKPDWSPELLLSYCYISHLKAVRASLYREIGGCRIGFEGSQDHDLFLRASEKAQQIGHVSQILYHRRALTTSMAFSGHAKPYSFEAGRRAVAEAFRRRGVSCQIEHPPWAARLGLGIYVPIMPDTGPSVALVIPTRNNKDTLKQLIASLKETSYKNYNVYIIDNMSDDRETLHYLSKQSHKVIRIPNPGQSFSFAHINNEAAKQLSEDLILFLNDDTQVINPKWLSQMVGWLRLPGVGAVGARLLYPDGRVQHAGVLLPPGNDVVTAFKGLPSTELGYLCFAKVTRNCTAVTAAAMLTPRELFLRLGGFDEQNFAFAYNDVDYCLRLHDAGYRIVFCGEAELYHHESRSRGKHKPDALTELAALRARRRGRKELFYSPHLDPRSNAYEIKPMVVPPCTLDGALRVLVITHNLNHEGAPNSGLELALGLRRRGVVDPVVISPQDGPLRAAYENERVRVEIMPEARIGKGLEGISEYDRLVSFFCEKACVNSYDLVYCNTALTFWGVDAAHRAGVPSVWNIRESEPWETYYDELPRAIASRALMCFAMPYRVVFVADSTRARWAPIDRMNNYQVIYNGLDVDRFGQETCFPPREEARRLLGLKEMDVGVLLLGTVCPRKGQEDLLLALERLPASSADRLSVFIVGSRPNPYSRRLEEIASRTPTHVCGKIHIIPETGEVAIYWNAVDIFCCTSRIESYPRVILEAMAKSLPIITTPVFGIKEQVRENVNALFYNPGDVENLAKCLDRLVVDSDLRAQLASNNPLVLSSLTNYEEMLAEYGTVFNSAAVSSPPAEACLNNRFIGKDTFSGGEFTSDDVHVVGSGKHLVSGRWSGTVGTRYVLAMLPLLSNGSLDGPSYVRVVRPLAHHSLSRVLTLSLAKGCGEALGQEPDALLIQRDAVRSPNEANDLIVHCQRRKVRLIYEIDDDLLHLPGTHPSAVRYSPSVKEAMQTIAQHADTVVVSTAPLRKEMMKFNKNVVVLPNALDERLWESAKNPRRKTDRYRPIRILYMGTRTHDDDLRVVIHSIKRLKERYCDRITFTCVGGFARKAPEIVYVENEREWPYSYPEFAKWMARSFSDYDIAIAPLAETEFNRHKSYIKYLDYGICGFAPILSNVEPYQEVIRHGENGMLVENDTGSWYETLCSLVEDATLRSELGRTACEDVLARHTLAAQAEKRQRFWNDILG